MAGCTRARRSSTEFDASHLFPHRSKRIIRSAVATTLTAGIALMFWMSVSWADPGPSGPPPLPPIRPPSSSDTQPGAATTPVQPPTIATPSAPQPPDAAACLAELKANHIEAEIVPPPPAPLAECVIAEPVRLSSIGLSNGSTIDMPDRPILDCAFASTFTEFAQNLMAPLATAMLGSGIAALATGGYSCRSPIRLPSGNPNPHAMGIAIDLSAITLADRRRIAIGHEANSAEALFVRTMRQAACGWFTTVLGAGHECGPRRALPFRRPAPWSQRQLSHLRVMPESGLT
jgi:hypothetical protein